MVEYLGEEGDYTAIIINGTEFEVEPDEYKFIIPKSVLRDIKLEEIHPLYKLELCEKLDEDMVFLDTTPFIVSREILEDKSVARVEFEDSGRRKHWDGPVGFNLYMETKRDIIKEFPVETGST